MSSTPLFSVITIAWRDLPGLRRTAASVENQVFRDFEWVVIDGGSDDGTPEWLASLPADRCRWVSEPDRGIFDAMNKGLDRAGGEYVVFLNAGDEFAAASVLADVAAAVRDRPDFVYGDSVDVGEDGRELYRPSRSVQWLRNGMFTSHQSMYFRRAHAPELRHDLRFPTTGDYAFVAVFLAAGAGGSEASCRYVGKPLCRFALGGTNFTARRKAIREDYRIRREVMGLDRLHAGALLLLHTLHFQLKLRLPGLAAGLRYQKPEDEPPAGAS